MKINIKSCALGLILGLILAIATPANATGDAMPAIERLIVFIQETVMEAFKEGIADLKEQFTLSNKKEGGRISSAIGAASDAESKLAIDLYNANISFQSKVQSNVCETNDTAQGVIVAEKIKNKSIPVLGKPMLDSNISTTNVTAQIDRIIQTHDKNFCGKQDKECEIGDHSNYDLSAWATLKQSGYSDEEKLAAYNFIAIATNARPTQALSNLSGDTVQNKEAKIVLMEESARLSISQNTFLNAISDRIKTRENGDAIGVREASALDVRQFEVYRRYGNPAWVDEITSDSYVPAIKEMALMLAYQIKQADDLDKRFERIEMALATLAAIESKRASREALSTIRPRASESVNEQRK